MRTLMKVSIPVEQGNKAIQDGSLPRVIQQTMESLRPEAAYFTADSDGKRHALIVFDLKDSSDIPVIAEPLFIGFNAEVTMTPVMSAQDLQAGLTKFAATAR
jgi:hypothetical protein